MTFPVCPLVNVTEKIGSGSTPRGGDSVYIESGTSLIRSQNVYNSKFDNAGLVFIDDKIAEKMKGVSVYEDDVLLNITGDSVARCCKVNESILPARVNQHVAIIRTNKKSLNPDFLMFYLTSPYMQAKLLSWAGTGGTRKALTKGMIEGFDVPTPEIDIQNEIAEKLINYNDLIENNQRRIQLLEESARLLYKEWFVHLRFPGHEHVKIIDGVPEKWMFKNLGEICFQVKNTIKPSEVEESTNYIGLEHIPRRSITLCEWETAEKVTSNKFRYEEGDFIFGKIRPYFHKVGFTLTGGITSSDAIVIRPSKSRYYFYILMLISSDQFVSQASKTVKEGSKMPRADWGFLIKQKFVLPNDSLMEVFDDYMLPIIKQLKILSLQNKQLAQSRDILLPRLMNGELTV